MLRATLLALGVVAFAAPATAAAQSAPYPTGERPHSTIVLRQTPEVAARTLSLYAMRNRSWLTVHVSVKARTTADGAPVRGVLRVGVCPDASGVWRTRRCPVREATTMTVGPNGRSAGLGIRPKGVRALQVTFDAVGTPEAQVGDATPALALLPLQKWDGTTASVLASANARLFDHPRLALTDLTLDAAGIDAQRHRPTIRWGAAAGDQDVVTHWQWCWGRERCLFPPRQTVVAAGKSVSPQARPSLRGTAGAQIAAWADPVVPTVQVVTAEPLLEASVSRPVR